MEINDFITNKRFTTAFIDSWLYEKIDGDIVKIKPYGQGAGAYILSEGNKWMPYEYTHFKDVVENFGPHPNDYLFYKYKLNGEILSDVPVEAIFTGDAKELNDFIINLEEDAYRKSKDYINLLQKYYSYKATVEMIPADILSRIQALSEMQWEVLQVFNHYPDSIKLYNNNPVFIFLIAAAKYFYITKDNVKTAKFLISLEENTLLGLLGFDNSEAALNIFEKIAPSFYSIKSFLSLRKILQSNNDKIIDFLLEADELEGDLIECCANGIPLSLLEEIYYQCGIYTPDHYESLDKIKRYDILSSIMSLIYGYNCMPIDEITTIKTLNDSFAQAEIYYEYEKERADNKQASPDIFMLRPAATIYSLTRVNTEDVKGRLPKDNVNIIEYVQDGDEQNVIKFAVSYDKDENLWNILDYNAEETVIGSQKLFNEFQEWFYGK